MVLLAHLGFQVTAYDLSPVMVEAAKANLAKHGLKAVVREGDLRTVNADSFTPGFAAIIWPHTTSIIESDEEIAQAVKNHVGLLAENGVFSLQSTQYPNPHQNRIIRLPNGTAGIVTYIGRDAETEEAWLTDAGLQIIYQSDVDASILWPGVESYRTRCRLGLKPKP